jgi:hypothetical protein
MVVLDGNCAVGCGPGTDYRYIHVFQCMLERTDAITNEVLEPITFVLAYPTVIFTVVPCILMLSKSFIYQPMHNRVAIVHQLVNKRR